METKPLILMIDDTADFREIFSLKLDAAGFRVITASGGEEGIKLLKANKPDLVLLDMEMPGMNGVEVLTKIKSEPALAETKVIFLTSYGEPSEKQAWLDNKFAEEIGAMDYIRKTEDFDKIINHIKQYAPTSASSGS